MCEKKSAATNNASQVNTVATVVKAVFEGLTIFMEDHLSVGNAEFRVIPDIDVVSKDGNTSVHGTLTITSHFDYELKK